MCLASAVDKNRSRRRGVIFWTPIAGLCGRIAAADGASLYLIGKTLGHRQASTTERYAHLTDDPARAVAELVGQRFLQITGGEEGAPEGSPATCDS